MGRPVGLWLGGLALAGTVARAQRSPWAERIDAITAAMPVRGERLTPQHLDRLEAMLAELPAAAEADVGAALERLAHGVSTRWLQSEALQPRFVAWCDALARHVCTTPICASYLAFAAGEAQYAAGYADAAVAAFHRSGELYPKLRPHARARAFRVELQRQNFRAARAELAVARPEMEPFRALVYEAHFALRVGLFDSAAQKLAEAQRLLTSDPPPAVGVDDREQAKLAEMELALLRQDYDAVEALAVALQQRPLQPATAARARLRELQARIGRGELVSLDALQDLFVAANPLNRPGQGAALIAQAVAVGANEIARGAAETLLAGRELHDPTVTIETLVALGSHELREGTMPPVDSKRWREWERALHAAWRVLMQEWRELEPDGEALAFLQMETRRDLLSLWLRVRASAPDGAAACFDRYLEADASGSTARRMQLPPVSVQQALAALVPANGALLVFLPAPVGSHALVADHHGIDVVPLPPEGPLRRHVAALRHALAEGDGDAELCRRLGQPIADQLLPPALRARLDGAETLVVAGYELLHSLPLELLPLEGLHAWLGLRCAVVYVPSVTLAVHLAGREPAASTGRAVLLAGTAIAPGDAERWHHGSVVVDTATLGAAFPGLDPDTVDVRRDAAFAEWVAAPVRAELGSVIAHGIRDARRACGSGMLLAAPIGGSTGAVFATDLPAIGMPRVVFLGVCGARRAALRLGEDGGHRFTSAFLAAGSDAVIATDLDVRLDEVLALHAAFVRELGADTGVAGALLRARRQLRAAGAAPRAWAGFRLEGLPHARLHLRGASAGRGPGAGVTSPAGWIAGAVASVVLALGARWWRRRGARPAAAGGR